MQTSISLKLYSTLELLFLVFGFSYGQPLTAQDYKVYSKILRAFLRSEKLREKTVVFREKFEREIPFPDFYFDQNVKRLSKGLDSISKSPIVFNQFNLRGYELVLYGRQIENEIFKGDVDKGWKSFYAKFPTADGIISMSRIYYEPGTSRGLVCIGILRGGLWGAGYLVYFDLKAISVIRAKELIWQN